MPINKNIKIAAVSLDITWGDPEENRFNISKALTLLPKDTDIVVLPEMFTTGFVTGTERANSLAEEWNISPTLDFLRTKAAEYNFAFCGSFIIRESDGILRNRCVFVEPSGEVTVYDKHHLFSRGDEASILTPGERLSPVIRFRGWNCAMAVCYDIRFPVWNRNVGYRYDILLVPANWPESRAYLWEHLLIGRAIENQSYVAGVNRSGHDDYGTYNNLSFVFDCKGLPASHVLDTGDTFGNDTSILLSECSHETLKLLRSHFPVINDADRFRLE